jgi:outer membrane protein W
MSGDGQGWRIAVFSGTHTVDRIATEGVILAGPSFPETTVTREPQYNLSAPAQPSKPPKARGSLPWLAVASMLGAALLAVAPQLVAQSAGNGFLFEQPSGSVTIRGGYAHASASADQSIANPLNLDDGNFGGAEFGADVAVRVAPQLSLVLGASYAGASKDSYYRDVVDENNANIIQTTQLRRVPVMLTLRGYLTPPGRAVGRFAWVPARFAPYVGIGGGAMWYRFNQHGDFVDTNNNIYPNDMTTSAWTPAAQGVIGADMNLTPRLALTGEAKYIWARGSLDQNFVGFNKVDLSGLSATIGLTVRY